ncbi:F-box/WD repeat-containing protein 7-like [Gigantopelta aegis]|uniref:F-box/WD repeat-containing protein 7-like n=1 Tax=Gigantopelta aegis TaxID=1735272 RepID=UPI001B8895EF|nr:F-box/WD repeat-containing protein 7-like [Gigantopelta aegis]
MARRRIDINTATAVEFEKLVGVGACKAEAIIKHRKEIGSFSSVDDLSDVPGVSRCLVHVNRRRLLCRPLPHKARPPPRGTGLRRLTRRTSSQLSTSEAGSNSSSTTTTRQPLTRSRFHGIALKEQPDIIDSEQLPDDDVKIQNEVEQPDVPKYMERADSGAAELTLDECDESCAASDDDADDDDDEEEEDDHGVDSECSCDLQDPAAIRLRQAGGQCMGSCTEPGAYPCVHMKKRKSSLFKEDGLSAGKRICRVRSGHGCYSCHHAPNSFAHWMLGNRQSSSLTISRQRIPSKENPPPKLSGWLETFQAWSNAERLMALDELISFCDPTQVRHLMQVIEPQFQRDFISLLPKELALYVLSFLEPKDLLRAAQTCSCWRVLAEDNLLWREKCREESIDESLVYGSRLRQKTRSQKSPWKSLYMRQYQIEQNWRTGVIKPPKMLKGHDDHVITCLEFCGTRIVSGSDDNTLKVWSALSGKCLRTLVGHTGGVWSSQMCGCVVISGSTDRTLKVWNADTGQCKHTLYGHTSTVRCMSLHGNKVVSGSRDATLRLWDVENGHCLHVLMGHVAAVRCVQYDGRRVVSGAYDYTVRVWDPDTESCLHTLQGHTNRVYSLQFDGVHVVSGSLDTSIRVWEVETGNCLHTLIGHQSLTSGLELKDNILVSGNADSTVKVWDITSGQCLQTLQGPNKHQSAVTCLQFNKKFVITSSDDGTVKIWDLKTGDFLRNLVSLDSGGSGGVVWRLRSNNTKLVCAVGSRNGTEETKLLVLDFDVEDKKVCT